MSVKNFNETAEWFYELARNAKKVARAYKKADREAQKASAQLQSSFDASRAANEFAEQILGGRIVSNGKQQEVPVVVTKSDDRKRMWNEWFASIQSEMDRKAEENSTNEED